MYVFKSGIYTPRFIEALAMAGHLNLVTTSEVNAMLKDKKQSDIVTYLEALIQANAPKYRAKRGT